MSEVQNRSPWGKIRVSAGLTSFSRGSKRELVLSPLPASMSHWHFWAPCSLPSSIDRWWSLSPKTSLFCLSLPHLETPVMTLSFPGSSVVTNSPANAGYRRHRFDLRVGKIPWRRKWQPIPVFCLGNPVDRGTWWATVHGVAKSWIWQRQLSMHVMTLGPLGLFHQLFASPGQLISSDDFICKLNSLLPCKLT